MKNNKKKSFCKAVVVYLCEKINCKSFTYEKKTKLTKTTTKINIIKYRITTKVRKLVLLKL